VRRALEAGVEAVHLEEPEFWVQDGYSEGFKREWQQFYGEPWQPPHSSVDAQWRASNLKYYLYRRLIFNGAKPIACCCGADRTSSPPAWTNPSAARRGLCAAGL
jgi:hypothetical protein